MRASWRLLARERDLRLVLCAGLVSLSGDWILTIGLLYRVYAMTGSTVAAALTVLCSTAPPVLLGSVAGMFADRWDRKRTMVVADLLMAAGLLPLLDVHGRGQVWLVYAVLLFEGVVAQFFSPAQQAMVPRLVPDDQLLAANALNGQVRDVSRLAGSALGGIVAALGGVAAVALADAASFAGSAALLWCVWATGQVAPSATAALPPRRRLAAMIRETRDGIRLTARHRFLRALMIFVVITCVGEGIFSTLVTPFLEHILHASSQEFGLVSAAQAVGGIAGGLLAVSVSQRVPATRLFCWGAVGFGAVDLAIALYPLGYRALWPSFVLMIVVGLPGALVLAGLMTLFQRNTEDSYRGRVFGALNAVEGFAMLTGTLAAGFLSRPLGIVPVFAVQGAGYVLAGLGMLMWLREETTLVPLVTEDVVREGAR